VGRKTYDALASKRLIFVLVRLQIEDQFRKDSWSMKVVSATE
jgi:hypothetical protein